jgi:hypothetical protein
LYANAAFREWQSDPAGADAKLECPAVANDRRQEVDCDVGGGANGRLYVAVVDGSNAVAVRARAIFSHA